MVVGMQHRQQQPHASPATVVEDATTPGVPVSLQPSESPPVTDPLPVNGLKNSTAEECSSTTTCYTSTSDNAAAIAATAAATAATMAMQRKNEINVYVAGTCSRVKLRDVNPHLVCVLCHGYFVDATTIDECLHSFCRSCIILYLETKSYCPICEVQINSSKPQKSLKPDKTLQDIVYKLVPGLFHAEMKRRSLFYQDNPHRDLHLHPEHRGISVDRLVYSPQNSICFSLEYYDTSKEREKWDNGRTHRVIYQFSKSTMENKENSKGEKLTMKKYFCCPAAVRVADLKKLIRMKYSFEEKHNVELFYRRESLPDDYSLMDIAYIYAWKRNSPLQLYYRIDVLSTIASASSMPPICDEAIKSNHTFVPAEEISPATNISSSIAYSGESDMVKVAVCSQPHVEILKQCSLTNPVSHSSFKNSKQIEGGVSDSGLTLSVTTDNNYTNIVIPPKLDISQNEKRGSIVHTSTTAIHTMPKVSSKLKPTFENGHKKMKKLSVSNTKTISTPTPNDKMMSSPIKSYLAISSILNDVVPDVKVTPQKISPSNNITATVASECVTDLCQSKATITTTDAFSQNCMPNKVAKSVQLMCTSSSVTKSTIAQGCVSKTSNFDTNEIKTIKNLHFFEPTNDTELSVSTVTIPSNTAHKVNLNEVKTGITINVSEGNVTRTSASRNPTSCTSATILLTTDISPKNVSLAASSNTTSTTSARPSTTAEVIGKSKVAVDTGMSTTYTLTTNGTASCDTLGGLTKTTSCTNVPLSVPQSHSAGIPTSVNKPIKPSTNASLSPIPSLLSLPSLKKNSAMSITPVTTTGNGPIVTSCVLTASSVLKNLDILANTKIPSSLEITWSQQKNSAPLNVPKENFQNASANTPSSGHAKSVKKVTSPILNVFAGDRDPLVMKHIKEGTADNRLITKISKDKVTSVLCGELSVSTSDNVSSKRIFSPNILPEVSITLNPHPEQTSKRLMPETSYDVSCFKPCSTSLKMPPLAPLGYKNVQTSPSNSHNKKGSSDNLKGGSKDSFSPSNYSASNKMSSLEKVNATIETVAKGNGGHTTEFIQTKPVLGKVCADPKEKCKMDVKGAKCRGIPKLISINSRSINHSSVPSLALSNRKIVQKKESVLSDTRNLNVLDLMSPTYENTHNVKKPELKTSQLPVKKEITFPLQYSQTTPIALFNDKSKLSPNTKPLTSPKGTANKRMSTSGKNLSIPAKVTCLSPGIIPPPNQFSKSACLELLQQQQQPHYQHNWLLNANLPPHPLMDNVYANTAHNLYRESNFRVVNRPTNDLKK